MYNTSFVFSRTAVWRIHQCGRDLLVCGQVKISAYLSNLRLKLLIVGKFLFYSSDAMNYRCVIFSLSDSCYSFEIET